MPFSKTDFSGSPAACRRWMLLLSGQTPANRFCLWSRWQLPALRSRLSRNLALPATRQPGTAGKHGVRAKRSWLERERQKRPSLVRKAKADRNAGGVFTGIHRCGAFAAADQARSPWGGPANPVRVLAAGGIEHRAHRGGGLLADDEVNRRFGMQPLAMLAAAS